jgi:hypothetical protein
MHQKTVLLLLAFWMTSGTAVLGRNLHPSVTKLDAFAAIL